MTAKDIREASAKALVQLLQTPEYMTSGTIFVYVSYQQELSTFPLIQAAFLDGKAVAVPKVGSKQKMQFFKIRDTTELKPGFSGILEPDGAGIQEMAVPKENDMMILPGMLFDMEGRRLGYGGGFYDVYLKKCREQGTVPVLAGFTYDFQLFQKGNVSDRAFADGKFPSEDHDQRVNMLVTPTKIIYI